MMSIMFFSHRFFWYSSLSQIDSCAQVMALAYPMGSPSRWLHLAFFSVMVKQPRIGKVRYLPQFRWKVGVSE